MLTLFTTNDIAEYYNTTQIHYEKWWNLKDGMSLHYGIWEPGVKNFTEAVHNTNRVLMELADIKSTDKVLDAGCGVGGAAVFITKNKKAKVTGITLSEKQVAYAKHTAKERNLETFINFDLQDYTKTNFKEDQFDVVWACESVSSARDKSLFIAEAFRVLKKGGRLIMSDCFLGTDDQKDPESFVKKWGATWGVSSLVTAKWFANELTLKGFTNVKTKDYSKQITKSAKRMYYAYLAGTLPSITYNLLHPNVSRFAKDHYKCGLYQWKAFKKNLWTYHVICAIK